MTGLVDLLYLHEGSPAPRAQVYGKPIEYAVEAWGADGSVTGTGMVRVIFSELPVKDWHSLSNEEKRQLGVSSGAGVSVVRTKREIDFGWFFMGSKRKENKAARSNIVSFSTTLKIPPFSLMPSRTACSS